jgi:NADH-quinone oxidoreductase subunit C
MSEGPKPASDNPDTPGSPKPGATPGSPKPEATPGSPKPEATPGSPKPEATPGSPKPEATPGSPKPEATPGSPKPEAKAAAAKPAPPKPEAKAAAPPGPPDQAPPADLAVPAFVTAAQAGLAGAVEQVSYWVGDWTVIVPAVRFSEVCTFLRAEPGCRFDYLSDLTAVDWPTRDRRFDVVACLYSTTLRHRVRVKARLADGEAIPSLTGVWPAANWLEREVYDMFGVTFTGHPDLRRMLMPSDWQGHPQRKDYPLEGPGELLMESPQDWLKARQKAAEADVE